MNDPTKDEYSVDHYSNYPKQTEVHGSSGIANNAFYLLAQGGTNKTSKPEVKDGIGIEKGLKIYGRALDHYMTPSTTFAQAREATIKAATDLYGANSAEVQKVKESWARVGVGTRVITPLAVPAGVRPDVPGASAGHPPGRPSSEARWSARAAWMSLPSSVPTSRPRSSTRSRGGWLPSSAARGPPVRPRARHHRGRLEELAHGAEGALRLGHRPAESASTTQPTG